MWAGFYKPPAFLLPQKTVIRKRPVPVCPHPYPRFITAFPEKSLSAPIHGEFHTNLFLRNQGYTIDGLVEHCYRFVKPRNVSIVRCDMAE